MNYQRIYDQIIERARSENRKKGKGVYYEAHHIIPKCIGGEGNTREWKTHSNIVLLTGREHFLCHWILIRLYPNNRSLLYAFDLMCSISPSHKKNRIIPSSRVIQEINELKSKLGRGSKFKKDQSLRFLGKPRPKIKCPHCGKEGGVGNMERWHFDNCLKNINCKREYKTPISPIKKCPHCGLEGKGSNMIRWHFDNCLNKPGNQNLKRYMFDSGIMKLIGKKQKIIECPHCGKEGGVSGMKSYHFDKCKHKINI
jgi:endogenous inhibitor of DNA gyrase (YacG/DUF329 family)